MTVAWASGHQLSLVPTGEELRDAGIASVSRYSWVDSARGVAEAICRVRGTVTTDDIHHVMNAEPAPHPNAWGALFHDKRFAWTGEYVKSKRPEAHARMIRVWRLR